LRGHSDTPDLASAELQARLRVMLHTWHSRKMRIAGMRGRLCKQNG
jgi:hypothetical protein